MKSTIINKGTYKLTSDIYCFNDDKLIVPNKVKKFAVIKILAIDFGVAEFTVKYVPDLHFFAPIENLKYNIKLI